MIYMQRIDQIRINYWKIKNFIKRNTVALTGNILIHFNYVRLRS